MWAGLGEEPKSKGDFRTKKIPWTNHIKEGRAYQATVKSERLEPLGHAPHIGIYSVNSWDVSNSESHVVISGQTLCLAKKPTIVPLRGLLMMN